MTTLIGKIRQLTYPKEHITWEGFKGEYPPKKVLGIIQARSTSKRLPGKIFKKIGDRNILEHCINNCTKSDVAKWIIAMPKIEENKYKDITWIDKVEKVWFKHPHVKENDVLGRFVAVSNEFPEYEWIVRITADSPFLDPKIIDETVEHAIKTNRPQFDYFNEGSCVAVFRREDLLRADKEFKDKYRREHVCEGFRKGFEKRSIDAMTDLNRERKLYKEGK